MALAPGTRLGAYHIVAPLGVGGMGEVYLASDPRLDRQVAIKVISPEVADDPDRLRRFAREARTASSLNHPNIAHVYEIDAHEGLHFIVMEYVRGESLSQRIGGRPMPIADVIVYATQIADAMDEAHGHGVIHRDLKPANAIITAKGRLKILDFGLAKIDDDVRTAGNTLSTIGGESVAGLVLGTLDYMSPEQVRGLKVDRRSDIFSFGVMLYEMITGRLPFTGASGTDTVFRITTSQPEAVSRFAYNVPADLDRIVRKCLEKETDRRYQTVRELLVDLSAIRRDTSGVLAPPPTGLFGRRRLWAVFAVVGLAFALAAGTAFIYFRPDVIDSLAIVPEFSSAADQRADLTEGVAALLVNSLSSWSNLTLIPRQMSFAAARTNPDSLGVARDLGAHAALVVRVTQRGELAELVVELVDVIHPTQMLRYQETRNLAELEQAQESLVAEVVNMLELRLSAEEVREREVFELYQQGRILANKRNELDLRKAIGLYDQALLKDRNYALAYAGLAQAYNLLQIYSFMTDQEASPNARKAAERAITIDSSLAEAHTQRAWVLFRWEWDWPAAERAFTEAIALDPDHAEARSWMGMFLSAMNRSDDAMVRFREAQELDRLSPTYRAQPAWALYMSRRYQESVEVSLKAAEAHQAAWMPQRFLGLAQEQLGNANEAVNAFEKALKLEGEKSTLLKAELVHAYGVAGRRSEAGRLLAQLSAEQKKSYVSPFSFAIAAVGLGDIDGALQWLEVAFRERANQLVWIKVDPRLDPLRAHSRFIKLLAEMKLQ